MAEAAKTLSEQYLLKKEDKVDAVTIPTEEPEVKTPPISESVEVETPKIEESPVVVSDETDSSTTTIAEESTETTPNENESVTEEANVSAEPEESEEAEEAEEEPEIKLETAPADFRFPTTNQSRHCFTRYIEYHRCVAAKGDDAAECDKFAKYYRALCPGEWVDRWNEQRENGTFPGPL